MGSIKAKPNPPELLERIQDKFWDRVEVASPESCWNWRGYLSPRGYGRIRHKGRYYGAHRLALALDGRIPEPHHLACHKCDNPACCKPEHLYRGSPLDNVRDQFERGRNPSRAGCGNGRVRLTEKQVQEIRNSPLGYKRLRKAYGVGRTTIRDIKNHKTWKFLK